MKTMDQDFEAVRDRLRYKVRFALDHSKFNDAEKDREWICRLRFINTMLRPDTDPALVARLTSETQPFNVVMGVTGYHTGMGGAAGTERPATDNERSSGFVNVATTSAGVGQPLYDPVGATRIIQEDPAQAREWWPKKVRPTPPDRPRLPLVAWLGKWLDW